MSRYSNIDYVLNMPITDGAKLIRKAREEKDREEKWLQFCVIQPWLKDKNMTFDKWYNPPKQTIRTKKSKAEVIDLAEAIRKADQERR